MKVIAPFDARIRPPKRFWTALWKPGVQADHPDGEFAIMRRSMVPGAPHVLLNSEESGRVRYLGGFSLWAGIKRVSAAIANWMIRREAREEEERLGRVGKPGRVGESVAGRRAQPLLPICKPLSSPGALGARTKACAAGESWRPTESPARWVGPTRVVLPPPRRPGDRSSARSGPSQTISEEGYRRTLRCWTGNPEAVRHSKSASQIVLIFICLSLEAQ